MTHKFNPEHIERLLAPERLVEMDPEDLLKKEGLKEGDRFAARAQHRPQYGA